MIHPNLHHVRRWSTICILLGVSIAAARSVRAADKMPAAPLSLHPDNPHYLLFRGKPTILIGSTEHYGAVLNRDFDDVRYLDAIRADGMNVTRLFSGAYVEPDGAFNISHNTLAPAADRFIAPWARSQTPGYANGGNKFDLSQWDEGYFHRLHDFVAQASERGIVVEVVLFCPYYEEPQWNLSPLNAKNNVNHIGDLPRTRANTLDNGSLLAVQDAMVRRFAAELKSFDNFYFEICNEPYFGGVTLDWQHHIAETIHGAEKQLQRPHLIAQNISNGAQRIEHPDPLVSIFNFHYATPPDAVTQNDALDKVIADDETGFKGTDDAIYRMEAWDFVIVGGGIFDNLDYSFTAGHEDGSFPLPPKQPGGGSRALRQQFRILHAFINGFDFIHMKPNPSIVRSPLPKGVTARVLAREGSAYALYLRGQGVRELTLALPAGHYHAQWIDTRSGNAMNSADLDHPGGDARLPAPNYEQDVALRIVRNR
jgi:hypothetical protein